MTNTAVANTTNSVNASAKNLAVKFNMQGNEQELVQVLKSTAFKGSATNEQFIALMLVADQYNLNPFTKEIYAFPDKANGITPVVGVDGWSRIINSHPQFDGMKFEFEDNGESCTCQIFRKDRNHPISITEYLDECKRDTSPWKSHPKRMLRHKAMIQAARLAFGFAGIYDPDEAERIVENIDDRHEKSTPQGNLAQGDISNPKYSSLKETAREVAEVSNREEFRAWFGALSKEERKLFSKEDIQELNNVLERKEKIEVIDHETGEIIQS